MSDYPSHDSVPSAFGERILFGAAAILAIGWIAFLVVQVVRRPETVADVVSMSIDGLGLPMALGLIGLLLRWWRLKRLAKREAFLAALAKLQ